MMMVYNRTKPYLAVIFLQFGLACLFIIAKFALNQGMNIYTFAVYRNVFATAVIAPFALLLERKGRPRMNISILLKIMLLGMLEPVVDQILYYSGMKYTTATFSTAMSNVVPAMAFLMAWIFRLEKVNIKEIHSQGKIVGTTVTVGGAMIMTLVKGPIIGLPWTKSTSQHHHQSTNSTTDHIDYVKGGLMITAGCFCWACFYIMQAITLKSYPAELSLTALICMAGAVQGTILTFIVERSNTAIWSLHCDAKFLAAIYGGVICSGVGYYLSGTLMKERGPVFVTAFSPLSMVIVAILGSFVLAEQMDLGRVLGAVTIVIGLYLVIWGKSKDQRLSNTGGDQQITMTNCGATTSNHNHANCTSTANRDHDNGTRTAKANQDHESVSITIPTQEAT